MLSHAPTPESCKHFVLQDRCFSPKIQIFSAFRPIAASGGRLLPSRGDPNSVPCAGGPSRGGGSVERGCRRAELLSGAPRQGKGTPAGYLSGSTWMAIIVPAPKRARRRCSMSTVSACEWATLIAPSTRTCTSMAIEAPMRRVRRLCGSRTSGLAVTIERISCSTSAGSDFSSSSPSPVRIRSSAILKMKTAPCSGRESPWRRSRRRPPRGRRHPDGAACRPRGSCGWSRCSTRGCRCRPPRGRG